MSLAPTHAHVHALRCCDALCCALPCCVRMMELLVVRYPVAVALGLFITVGGLLLAAFLGYQVGLHGLQEGGVSASCFCRLLALQQAW
jgi:hypothetical protein